MGMTDLGEFDLGTPIGLTNLFEAGDPLAPADPASVSLRLLAPSGEATVETYNPGNISRTSEGHYAVTVLPDEPGVWAFRWIGAGSSGSANSGRFIVTAPQA